MNYRSRKRARLLCSSAFIAIGVFFLYLWRQQKSVHSELNHYQAAMSTHQMKVEEATPAFVPDAHETIAGEEFVPPTIDLNSVEAEEIEEAAQEEKVEDDPKVLNSILNYKKEDDPVAQAAKKVSCRHRWTKYLDQQNPRPNAELDSMLKRYVRLHDKHLRDMPLDSALQLPLTSRVNRIRYLVWMPSEHGGKAGQMLSLVSAFLFALLTDRVLLVDFPEEIEHVLCEPFPNSSWLLPAYIKTKLTMDLPKAIHAVRQRQPLRKAYLTLERGNMMDDKHLLSCHGTLKNVFNHIQWLVIRADYDYIQTIASNRAHEHQLSQLFHQKDAIYAVLHRSLLHPSNFLWERITLQYHKYFSDEDPKPLRIVLHPANIGETVKHVKAIHQIIKRNPEKDNSVSVYTVPFEMGADWIDEGEVNKLKSSSDDESPLSLTGVRVGSSASLGLGISPFVGEWRKFIIDVWMTSFAHDYIIPEYLPVTVVPGLLFRNKLNGVWLLSDDLDRRSFKEPEAMSDYNALADLVDCSLIARK